MKKAKIILHCSDSDVLAHNDVNIIRRWHKARGFKDVGYHFFIQYNGTIQKGRPLDEDSEIEPFEVGAHVKGHNLNSIGICLHGRNEFTNNQYRAAAALIRTLQKQFDLDKGFIYGHNQFNKAKTCPNFNVDRFIKSYLPELSKNGRGSVKPAAKTKSGSKAGAGKKSGSTQQGAKQQNKGGSKPAGPKN